MKIKANLADGDPFGVLLRKLRESRGVRQADVAGKIEKTASYVTLLEKGERKPPQDLDTLHKIAEYLQLSVHERNALVRRAYSLRPEPPLYLLTPEEEGEFQRESRFNEIWIIARNVLDVEEPMYSTTSTNIQNKAARYVFFQPNSSTFDLLLSRLRNDYGHSPHTEQLLRSQLECILAPDTFFFASFAIANPNSEADMYGQESLHVGDRIMRCLHMDLQRTRELTRTIRPIYEALRLTQHYSGKEGIFEKHFPPRKS